MPRDPIDYSKTIIYKIQHIDNDELLYVGHTTDFNKRKCRHKANCNSCQFKVYQMIRENSGWNSFVMVMVEEFPCDNKLQVCKREDEVMCELKASMNTYDTVINIDKRTEYLKHYNEATRNKRIEHHKINRDKRLNYMKEYYKATRHKRLEKMKQYRETKQKEKMLEFDDGSSLSSNGSNPITREENEL